MRIDSLEYRRRHDVLANPKRVARARRRRYRSEPGHREIGRAADHSAVQERINGARPFKIDIDPVRHAGAEILARADVNENGLIRCYRDGRGSEVAQFAHIRIGGGCWPLLEAQRVER